MLPRILLVIIVLGLLLGAVSLTEIGTVLQIVWDWVVDTLAALIELLRQ